MSTIKVLGSGCANCQRLTALVEQALAELGRDESVGKVTDPGDIVGYGVMATPALVVDGRVVVAGRIPSLSTLRAELEHRLAPI
jgi:small redox-active disulfide protein 2